MTQLSDWLGQDFDLRMAEWGYREQQVRIGRKGTFAPMPYVGDAYEGDKYSAEKADPGTGIREASVNLRINVTVPYPSLVEACAREGVLVEDAVSVGWVWYYRQQPDQPWQPYQVHKEVDSNNHRWLISLINLKV